MTDCTRCGKTGLQPDAIHTCTPLALVLADSISQMDTFTDYQRGQLLQAAAELRRLHAENESLQAAIRKLHAAKGRYHTQIAACDLFDLVGLPNERPKK